MVAEHFKEGILITDPLCWDATELVIGVRDHHRSGSVLEELKGIVSDDGITDNHLVSIPDNSIEIVVNKPDVLCQCVVVCVFEEGVNLVNIYNIVLKFLMGKIRNDLLADRIQTDGRGIFIEVTELPVLRQFSKRSQC